MNRIKTLHDPSEARAAEAGDAPAELAPERASLAAILETRRFDISHPPAVAVPVYQLGEAIIATPGNIVGIQAQAKAGKSAFVGAMVAAAMGGKGDCLGIVSENPRGLAMVHFDTEQAPADHHAGIVRSLYRAGLASPPTWLRSYRLADVPLLTRRSCLPFDIERAAAECGGIHSVIIDGIGDLCADPNDPAEAFGIVDSLHQLAIRYNAPIFAVLHENPGSETGKTRGHLGSQLERKAETNLRLAKDGEGITIVFAERARHAHIPREQGQRFKWCGDAKMHVSLATNATTKSDEKREQLAELAKQCFHESGGVGLTWEQLHTEIETKEGCSRGTARRRFDAMKMAHVIRQTGEKYQLK